MAVSLQDGKQIGKKLLGAMLLSIGVTFILLLLLTCFVYRSNPSESFVKAALIGIKVLACFFGGIYCGHKSSQRRFLWGMLLGGCYALGLLAIQLGAGEAAIFVWPNLYMSLICLGCGMLGGMISHSV